MILAGTDLGTPLTYPGFAVHDELDLLVRDGGLRPRRALWAATLGPAQFFHLERDAGSIVPGKVADLVLLDAKSARRHKGRGADSRGDPVRTLPRSRGTRRTIGEGVALAAAVVSDRTRTA